MNRFTRWALAPLAGLLCLAAAAPAIAANAPTYTDPAGFQRDPIGVVCLNATTGALESCGGGGSSSSSAPLIASANFTTPAGTTAYADADLIANSGTAGSVTPLDFTACATSGGGGIIRRARYYTPDTGMAGKSVYLWLFKASPTVANGDNAAFSATQSTFLGRIPITASLSFSDPQQEGIGVPENGSEISFNCTTTHLYGLLSANGASGTLQGSKVHTIELEILP